MLRIGGNLKQAEAGRAIELLPAASNLTTRVYQISRFRSKQAQKSTQSKILIYMINIKMSGCFLMSLT
jgi:hypothetical protein